MQLIRRRTQAASQHFQAERATHDVCTARAASAPQPLDPKLLPHVGGGTRTDAPKHTW